MIRVEVKGLKAAATRLAAMPEAIPQAIAVALNRTLVAAREEQLIAPAMAATGINKRALERRMPIRKASRRNLSATILVSSAGIPVTEYRWWHEPAGKMPTRHRIMVAWPGGGKVAAGFVNPRGKQQLPLSTRIKGKSLAPALGPSAAALRMALYGPGDEGETIDQFRARFSDLMSDVANGRPVPDA